MISQPGLACYVRINKNAGTTMCHSESDMNTGTGNTSIAEPAPT